MIFKKLSLSLLSLWVLLWLWPGRALDPETGQVILSSAQTQWSLVIASFVFSIKGIFYSIVSYLIIFSIFVFFFPLGSVSQNFFKYLSRAGSSIPTLILAPLLTWFFALQFNLLPIAQYEGWSSLVLPVLIVTLRPLCQAILFWILQFEENRELPFLTYAKSKGGSQRSIYRSHLIRYQLSRWVSVLILKIPTFFYSFLFVEVIFNLPGYGQFFIKALFERDRWQIGLMISSLLIIVAIGQWGLNFWLKKIDPRLADESYAI